MTWETVIGLEVHAQLKTQSKLFSPSATAYGAAPNTQTSYIDAGLPGVLPVLNREVVHMAIQFGFAIEAEICDLSYFERKNYFYPDLPKGYQISQFQRPIIANGHLNITLGDRNKSVTIERAHLEEDAGKSLHEAHHDYTGIDLNRAGTPLLEIVTSPCLYSAKEAVAYLKTLHQLLRFLDICDGNMQEGSFRCDVNLSLRRKGQEQLGTRTELKNLNSFRYIEKAILHEQLRQQDLLERGEAVIQETRLYSPATDTTHPMRSKEQEHDYRYFPDPDLLPIKIHEAQLAKIKATLPELPVQIQQRLIYVYGLAMEDAAFLLTSPAHVQFFEAVKMDSQASVKTIVNWLKGPYAAALNETGSTFAAPPVSSKQLAILLDRVNDKIISLNNAKIIFTQLLEHDENIDDIISTRGFEQSIDHSEIESVVYAIVKQYPKQADDYRAGKEKLLGFFVGQVMKETKGKTDPALVSELLRQFLS